MNRFSVGRTRKVVVINAKCHWVYESRRTASSEFFCFLSGPSVKKANYSPSLRSHCCDAPGKVQNYSDDSWFITLYWRWRLAVIRTLRFIFGLNIALAVLVNLEWSLVGDTVFFWFKPGKRNRSLVGKRCRDAEINAMWNGANPVRIVRCLYRMNQGILNSPTLNLGRKC